MTERSYLFTCDDAPRTFGFGGYGVSQCPSFVPLVHKLLVANAPRVTKSALFDAAGAILGDRAGAYERVVRLFDVLGAGPLSDPRGFEAMAREMTQFMAAAPAGRFFLLEPVELFGPADAGRKVGQLFTEIAGLAATVDNALAGQDDAWLTQLRGSVMASVDGTWWASTLFHRLPEPRPYTPPAPVPTGPSPETAAQAARHVGLVVRGVARGRAAALRAAVSEVLARHGLLERFDSVDDGLAFTQGTDLAGALTLFTSSRSAVVHADELESGLRDAAHTASPGAVAEVHTAPAGDPVALGAYAITVMDLRLLHALSPIAVPPDWQAYDTWEQRAELSWQLHREAFPEAFWREALRCPLASDVKLPFVRSRRTRLLRMCRHALCALTRSSTRVAELDTLDAEDVAIAAQHLRPGASLDDVLAATFRDRHGALLDHMAAWIPRVVAAEALAVAPRELFQLLAAAGRRDMLTRAAEILVRVDNSGGALAALAAVLPAGELRTQCQLSALAKVKISVWSGDWPAAAILQLPLGAPELAGASAELLDLLCASTAPANDVALGALVHAQRARTGEGQARHDALREAHGCLARVDAMPPDARRACASWVASAWALLAVAVAGAVDMATALRYLAHAAALVLADRSTDDEALALAVSELGRWDVVETWPRVPPAVVEAAARAARPEAFTWWWRVAHPEPQLVALRCAAAAVDPAVRARFAAEANRPDVTVPRRTWTAHTARDPAVACLRACVAARERPVEPAEITAALGYRRDVPSLEFAAPVWLRDPAGGARLSCEEAVAAAARALAGAEDADRAKLRAIEDTVRQALGVIMHTATNDVPRAKPALDRLHGAVAVSPLDPSSRSSKRPLIGLKAPAWSDRYITALAACANSERALQVAEWGYAPHGDGAASIMASAFDGYRDLATMFDVILEGRREGHAIRQSNAARDIFAIASAVLDGIGSVDLLGAVLGVPLSRVEDRPIPEAFARHRVDERARLQTRLAEALEQPLAYLTTRSVPAKPAAPSGPAVVGT
jgi:hypothetical protein